MGKMTYAQRRRLVEKMDLSRECPHCLRRLQPADIHYMDLQGTIRCGLCGQTFVVPNTAPSTS